jgi:hypothetical protein
MALQREKVILHLTKQRAFDSDQEGFITPLLASGQRDD